MAHFSVWQRSPFRNSFIPSRRHCRQTGPIYRAKSNLPFSGARNLPLTWGPMTRSVQFTGDQHPSSCLHKKQKTDYTRRFLGGRHPLCGIGVRSRMERTSRPAVDRARTADSRPAPGPLTFTLTLRTPDSLALLAAVSDACCAAKGVPLRDPRNPSEPELDHDSTFPTVSVMVMMVLLKDACTCTMPAGTFFFSFFLKDFFLPPLAAVFAGALVAMCSFQLSLGLRAGFLLVGHGAAP